MKEDKWAVYNERDVRVSSLNLTEDRAKKLAAGWNEFLKVAWYKAKQYEWKEKSDSND